MHGTDPFRYVPNEYLFPLRIGTLTLANNLILAPMAGYTNLPFRLIVKEVAGLGLVSAEMVAAMAPETRAWNRHFRAATTTDPAERPIAMQVYGRNVEACGRTAAALRAAGADIVDLNCGCPVRKAIHAGCGVALMDDPPLVGRILAAIRAAVDCPVTVKIRLGREAGRRNAVEVARIAEANGADAVTVHARYGGSKHADTPDYAGIREVKAALGIPVIANGDIDSAARIRQVREETGADGFMIGRAACGNPWLPRAILSELSVGRISLLEATHRERERLLRRHYDLLLALHGEASGTAMMRKCSLFYCQGLPSVRQYRDRFVRIRRRADFEALVAEFFGRHQAAQQSVESGPRDRGTQDTGQESHMGSTEPFLEPNCLPGNALRSEDGSAKFPLAMDRRPL